MANENKPVKKFQAGGVSAAIWQNRTTLKSGTEIETLSVSIDRRYKDKDGEWKNSSSLKLNDVPKAVMVLSKAYDYMASKDKDDGDEYKAIDAVYDCGEHGIVIYPFG